jgi:hypothetical protein
LASTYPTRPDSHGCASCAPRAWLSGAGEREVLALAAETPGTTLIIDDGLARRYAETLRVRFTGTAGALVKAKRQGLDAVAPVLDHLAALRFRLDAQTRAAVLRLVGEEK